MPQPNNSTDIDDYLRTLSGGKWSPPSSDTPPQPPPLPNDGKMVVGQSPQEVAAQQAYGSKAGGQFADDQAAAALYGARTFPLKQAIPLMDKLGEGGTGPGSETVNHLKSFFLTQTPQTLKDLGATPDKLNVANYDELKKYLTQYAQRQAEALGPHTNQGLSTTLTGQPNVEISNMAGSQLLRATLGVERMNHAKTLAFMQSGKPLDQYPSFASQWSTQADPRAYMLDLLNPQQRKDLFAEVGKSSPEARAAFAQQLQQAQQYGLVEPPSQ